MGSGGRKEGSSSSLLAPRTPPSREEKEEEDSTRLSTSPSMTSGKSLGRCKASGGSILWFNHIISKLWPRIMAHTEKMIENPYGRINMKVRSKMRWPLKSLRFSKFKLGTKAPRLGPLEITDAPKRPGFMNNQGIEIRCGFHMVSEDGDIELSDDKFRLGIKELSVKGTLIMRLECLLEEMPVVGGVVVCFLDQPDIHMRFSGMGEYLERTPMGAKMRELVEWGISSSLVMPNVMGTEIGTEEQGVDRALLRQPKPVYVLRVRGVRRGTGFDNSCFMGEPTVKLTLADDEWAPEDHESKRDHEFLVYDERQKLSIEIRENCFQRRLLGRSVGLTAKAVAERSNSSIDLFDPADPFGRPIGTVIMESTLLEVSEYDADKDKSVIVRIKIDEVWVPRELLIGEVDDDKDKLQPSDPIYHFGVGAYVKACVGDRNAPLAEKQTPIMKYMPLAPTTRGSAQPGVARRETTKFLDQVISEPKELRSIPAGWNIELPVEFILFLLIPISIVQHPKDGEHGATEQRQGDYLNLELRNKKGDLIGQADEQIKLSEVFQRMGQRRKWPADEGDELLQFKDPDNNLVSPAEVDVSFMGLKRIGIDPTVTSPRSR